jgi:hypothetical protein
MGKEKIPKIKRVKSVISSGLIIEKELDGDRKLILIERDVSDLRNIAEHTTDLTFKKILEETFKQCTRYAVTATNYLRYEIKAGAVRGTAIDEERKIVHDETIEKIKELIIFLQTNFIPTPESLLELEGLISGNAHQDQYRTRFGRWALMVALVLNAEAQAQQDAKYDD